MITPEYTEAPKLLYRKEFTNEKYINVYICYDIKILINLNASEKEEREYVVSFKDNLKSVMNICKINDSDLAQGINIDESLIRLWKHGQQKISSNSPHLNKLAKFFVDIDLDEYQKVFFDTIINSRLSDEDKSDKSKCIQSLLEWLISDQPNEYILHEKSIFDNTPVAIAISRRDKILYINQAYLDVFGYNDFTEIHYKNILECIPPQYQCERSQQIQSNLKDQLILPISYESFGLRKDGTGFPAYIAIENINLPDGPANFILIRDLSQKEYLSNKLSKHVKSQKLQFEVSKSFAESALTDLDETLNKTLKKIGLYFAADRSFIFQYSQDKKNMNNTHEWCAEGIPDEIADLQNFDVNLTPWWHEQIMTKEYLYIPSVSDLPVQVEHAKHMLSEHNIKSLLIIPMIHEGSVIGYWGLNTVNRTKFWSYDDIMILETLTQIITTSLAQNKYFNNLIISEKFYKAYFNSGIAKVLITEDATISLVNAAFEFLSGYSQKELVGRKWSDFIDLESAEKVLEYHQLRKDNYSLVPSEYMIGLKNKLGKHLDVQLSISFIVEKDETLVTLSDLTEINKLNRTIKAISSCNAEIIKANNETDLINRICNILVDDAGYQLAWLGIVEKDDLQTFRPIGKSDSDDGYVDDANIFLSDPIKGNGPAGKAIKANNIFVCKDIPNCTDFNPWLDKAMCHGYNSCVAIPFTLLDFDLTGAMCIYSERVNAFDEQEIGLLKDLVSSLVYGINAIRNLDVRIQTNELLDQMISEKNRLFLQTVTAFATIVEVRDPYTWGHQKTVTNMAVAIANEMGLCNEDLEATFIAAAMHDIGKISVPSEILSKPGKLTKFEFELIKEHSQKGYDIISQINFPWPIADIILQHHERMDGSGYPNGLKDKEIHLIARIIAVADTVDAMASHRPYRAAMGIEKALEEIDQLKVSKYDPVVVDACLRLFREKNYQIFSAL